MKLLVALILCLPIASKGQDLILEGTETFPLDIYFNAKKDSVKYVSIQQTANKRVQIYHTQLLEYREIDGVKIFQGDIEIYPNSPSWGLTDIDILPKIFNDFKIPDSLRVSGAFRIYDTLKILDTIIVYDKGIGIPTHSELGLWKNKTVKYRISQNQATRNIRPQIKKAIAYWAASGLSFEETNLGAGDHILFEASYSYTFNSSPIGRLGIGQQKIKLVPDVPVGTIVHEIGHSLGLWHEHSRPDRDAYIKILTTNILSGFHSEFGIVKSSYSYHGTNYDYASIMHYGESSFARKEDGKNLITIQPLQNVKIGQRNKPSDEDIKAIKKMYKL